MREIDPEPIENALEALTRGDRGEVRRFKQAEAWRDALLAGDGTVLAAIQANCPEADLDRVDQLVVEVRAAKAKPVRKRAARSLFRYLKKSITTS
jgi:ribosome-associated protein